MSSVDGGIVSVKRPVLILSSRLSDRQFRLHTTCCSIFDRLAGGESLGRTSGGESILRSPSWHMSRRSASGESLLHEPH